MSPGCSLVWDSDEDNKWPFQHTLITQAWCTVAIVKKTYLRDAMQPLLEYIHVGKEATVI